MLGATMESNNDAVVTIGTPMTFFNLGMIIWEHILGAAHQPDTVDAWPCCDSSECGRRQGSYHAARTTIRNDPLVRVPRDASRCLIWGQGSPKAMDGLLL